MVQHTDIKDKFNKYDNALDLINEIKNGERKLSVAKNDQKIFKSWLDEIKMVSMKRKSKQQKNSIHNIEMLYKARNEAIKLSFGGI